jgi:hypothetical protein
MPSRKGQVLSSPSVKLLLPTTCVALLGLKAPPELGEDGRVGPRQEDWARGTVASTCVTTRSGMARCLLKGAINHN